MRTPGRWRKPGSFGELEREAGGFIATIDRVAKKEWLVTVYRQTGSVGVGTMVEGTTMYTLRGAMLEGTAMLRAALMLDVWTAEK